ncbi:glycosyl transferase family 90-domain-containing protein [Mycena pura]|uniref:Glycosyl transferase family 90-domain-containing protein n=1 Tax=Mycena pura TaxID=153505 RepID=A0AAD6UY86_9AGAR|nr:glycosyl transferase family 90-domain-containing protein [Mycena pura]
MASFTIILSFMSSWIPASFKPPSIASHNGDSNPLLPTNGGTSFDEDDEDYGIELEMQQFAVNDSTTARVRHNWPPRYTVVAVFGIVILVATILLRSSSKSAGRSSVFPGPLLPGPVYDFWNVSNARIDTLFAAQSSTLAMAQARYALRNSRPPPPAYDKWYDFARGNSCLIDEYDQISRDFEPFYQLAQDDPVFFKKMIELGSENVKKDGKGMTTGAFAGGRFSLTDNQSTLYTSEWPRTFERFSNWMPDMNVILNGRDEPRILFNYRKADARPKALNVSDPTPFEHSPQPTHSYFKDEMQCTIPNRPTGFTEPANDVSAFMLYASSTQFTIDLYPILSMTKISPCFADILVPSEFYYSDSFWAPRYSHPNDINWADKTAKLYWRGMNSGGRMYDDNYHAFPRFRLIDIGRKHRKIMDVRLSGFHDDLCGERCNGEAIEKEYDVAHISSPREDVYKYKYVFDVDGNSFSGRYLGLLRSGTLVFKSTVFLEYFGDWLRPFEHYIPVLPDLSDLVAKVEWAIAHDKEAQAIQQAGQRFAERVLTDAQNDCYFSLVLLEWARLQGMADEVQATE